MEKEIYLAGGCFWGIEHYIKQIKGVTFTEVGYANGITAHPSYEDVCTDKTQFAETVHIKFNTNILTFPILLSAFFKAIDPTSLNRQGTDSGTQYRTGIYFSDLGLGELARYAVEELQKEYQKPLQIEVKPLKNFYRAEEYHQNYLDKNPAGYCHISPSLMEHARQINNHTSDNEK